LCRDDTADARRAESRCPPCLFPGRSISRRCRTNAVRIAAVTFKARSQVSQNCNVPLPFVGFAGAAPVLWTRQWIAGADNGDRSRNAR
jgi:hypothetical protein